MNLFSRADLRTLLARREWPCISLYIPTFYVGPQVTGNAVRFKKLLAEAESRTIASGMSAIKARDLFHVAKALIEDADFWQHQLHGFVLFLSPGMISYHKVPLHCDELLFVSDRFNVKPILPLLAGDGRFYILALSKSSVKCYHATRFSIAEVELKDAPHGIDDATKYVDRERQYSLHQGRSATGGGPCGAVQHGGGFETGYEKSDILRYFQMVDPAVRKVVASDWGPVVLAGVEYLQSLYREASGGLRLMEDWIEGNPESVSVRDLHERAWDIVAPVFRKEQEDVAALYLEISRRGEGGATRTPADIARILVAGRDGRVQHLFIPLSAVKWGRFHEESGEVRFDDTQKPDSEDLFERAAVQTIMTGGKVYAVPPEEMPGRMPIAAVLRY